MDRVVVRTSGESIVLLGNPLKGVLTLMCGNYYGFGALPCKVIRNLLLCYTKEGYLE